MPNFIDRRLNPKDKSIGNRQRFLRRAREELKRAVKEQVKSIGIADVGTTHSVSMPTRGVGEPTFQPAADTGDRERVLPGNREFSPGDRLRKQQSGGGGKGGAGTGEDEDDFQFALSRNEVLDLFFEDLELPDMVKLSLKETLTFKSRRAGFAVTGSPTNINVGRTMRNSFGRRVALRRPKQAEIDALLAEIAELERKGGGHAQEQLAMLQAELDWLERRRRRVPFIDTVDIRFNRFEQQPLPNASAVMFCLMDVSASMGEREKDLAKRFFVLLHLFLKRRYERIEIVFIRHTDEAREVDEETFFYSTQSGGTMVSTALAEMLRVIEARYPASEWNIYAAQASDGDNISGDSDRCITLLSAVMRLCQYYAYVEIIDERESEIFARTDNGTSLWRAYRTIDGEFPNFQMTRISKPADIYPVFRKLFARQAAARKPRK